MCFVLPNIKIRSTDRSIDADPEKIELIALQRMTIALLRVVSVKRAVHLLVRQRLTIRTVWRSRLVARRARSAMLRSEIRQR
jgi:hypothetical protein